MIPVVVGALGTIKKGMVENIKRVSERATVTETQKISMLGSAVLVNSFEGNLEKGKLRKYSTYKCQTVIPDPLKRRMAVSHV